MVHEVIKQGYILVDGILKNVTDEAWCGNGATMVIL